MLRLKFQQNKLVTFWESRKNEILLCAKTNFVLSRWSLKEASRILYPWQSPDWKANTVHPWIASWLRRRKGNQFPRHRVLPTMKGPSSETRRPFSGRILPSHPAPPCTYDNSSLAHQHFLNSEFANFADAVTEPQFFLPL